VRLGPRLPVWSKPAVSRTSIEPRLAAVTNQVCNREKASTLTTCALQAPPSFIRPSGRHHRAQRDKQAGFADVSRRFRGAPKGLDTGPCGARMRTSWVAQTAPSETRMRRLMLIVASCY